MHSGDIRDQSRKLSEIAPNVGRFFALPNFRERAFQKLYPFYHPGLEARHLEKSFVTILPLAPRGLYAEF